MALRILLANEFGAGRGPLVTLTRLALAFGAGFEFDAALCERVFEDVLRPLGATVFNGPRLTYRSERRVGPHAVPTASWGEYLGDLGFDRVARLREIVAWWRQVLRDRHVSMVLADYAPLAQLAARSLNIPVVATGQGFGLPPPDLPSFPILDPRYTARLHDEAQLLANVNTVAFEVGLPPLKGLSEIYCADLTLVHTLPFLDPYRAWRREPCLTPVTDIGTAIGGSGDEVFVYFSTSEFETPGLVEALASLPWPRRGYFPGLDPGVAECLTASGMVLSPTPVPVNDIARRSRLILNAGQHGILSLGLFAGVAQVCLPQHREHLFHAQRAEQAGVVKVVERSASAAEALRAVVASAYCDAELHGRAHRLAQTLRMGIQTTPAQQLAQAIEPLKQTLLKGGRLQTTPSQELQVAHTAGHMARGHMH